MFWVYLALAVWVVPSGILLGWVELGLLADRVRGRRDRHEVEQEAAEHARPLGNVSNVITLDSRRRRVTPLPSGTGWPEPLPAAPSRTPRNRHNGGRS